MDRLKKCLRSFFELFFPPPAHISVFDTLPSVRLAMHAHNTPVQVAFDCIAPLPYQKPLVRFAVQATKYHGHMRAAELLGEVLAPHVAEELAERRMFGEFEQVLVIPIPLHTTRLKERGYNQAERIATTLLFHLEDTHCTLAPTLLVRHKHTEPQAQSRGTKARFVNMHNAFSVPEREAVAGKDVLLIDDVVTTGATFKEARTTLRNAGARNILCVAVAH